MDSRHSWRRWSSHDRHTGIDRLDVDRRRRRAGECRRDTRGDPATGAALEPSYGLGAAADVDRAVSLAWQAFPGYRATSLAARSAFITTVADNIDALGDTLVGRVVAETGIPEPRVKMELSR